MMIQYTERLLLLKVPDDLFLTRIDVFNNMSLTVKGKNSKKLRHFFIAVINNIPIVYQCFCFQNDDDFGSKKHFQRLVNFLEDCPNTLFSGQWCTRSRLPAGATRLPSD